jgi:hypothetical protein
MTTTMDEKAAIKKAMRSLDKASLTDKDRAQIRRHVKDGLALEKETGIFYQHGVATAAPEGMILVHNHIRHGARTRSGTNGFRFWNAAPAPKYVFCDCGWRVDLGVHYRVRRHNEANNGPGEKRNGTEMQ